MPGNTVLPPSVSPIAAAGLTVRALIADPTRRCAAAALRRTDAWSFTNAAAECGRIVPSARARADKGLRSDKLFIAFFVAASGETAPSRWSFRPRKASARRARDCCRTLSLARLLSLE